MERLYAEVAVAQLSKTGEELCGDNVEITRTAEKTIVVLSDGLGSGVKANILATLTTKIASSLLKRGIDLEEVVHTIAQTLPVCKERKVAYSTLQIIELAPDGATMIVEYDSPETFLLRNGQALPFPTREKLVSGKLVKAGELLLQENDFVVAVSDGVIHSGIGGLLKLGWNWNGISHQLEENYSEGCSAADVAEGILNCCNGYYLGRPGDDSTVVVIKLRQPRNLTLLTGPPADPALDAAVVEEFLAASGKKAVAGGTTANVVGRISGRTVTVDLSYQDATVPPTAMIDGVDLVTEGVLTLNAAIERLGDQRRLRDASYRDGATRLTRLLLDADQIDIVAGTAVNPAHQNPAFPAWINIKRQILESLQRELEQRGKRVSIRWY